MARFLSTCTLLLLIAGCASQRGAVRLADDAELNRFLGDVLTSVEQHEWDAVISAADSAHYATQVQEVGIPEPQYVAELFGLHKVGNDIGGGEAIGWSDLNRIASMHLNSLEAVGAKRWSVSGEVQLGDGSRMNIDMLVMRRGDVYQLTGGLG